MLQMRDECRAHLHEQRFELCVLCARDQCLVDGVQHGLVIRNFVIDVCLVERRAIQLAQRCEILIAAALQALARRIALGRDMQLRDELGLPDWFAPLWAVIMSCAKSRTDCVFEVDFASWPASMSTWLAVTPMAAICASLGAPAPAARAQELATASHRATVN